MAKLRAVLEIVAGGGNPEDYKGLLDAMLEESRHWGDFDCKIVSETIVEDHEAYIPRKYQDEEEQ
jgi:hypothetical protein